MGIFEPAEYAVYFRPVRESRSCFCIGDSCIPSSFFPARSSSSWSRRYIWDIFLQLHRVSLRARLLSLPNLHHQGVRPFFGFYHPSVFSFHVTYMITVLSVSRLMFHCTGKYLLMADASRASPIRIRTSCTSSQSVISTASRVAFIRIRRPSFVCM